MAFSIPRRHRPKYENREVDGVRLTMELYFIGKEGEAEIYTEFFKGETKEEALGELSAIWAFERLPHFPHNNISINPEYFNLAKAVIISTDIIKINKSVLIDS
jgi:hypothetical protein